MNKPEVYLDMDGVIADFFTEYAKLAGVQQGNYRDIPPAKVDPTLDKMVGTDFFARLPKFPSADDLVNMIVKVYGHYHICSSPLRGDHEGSAKYKKIWIQQHLNPQPKNILITPNKAKYAKQADGTPNILIDDRGSNITAWEAAGGIGIKYQADEDSLQKIVDGFSRAKKIVQGKEKHEPQKLTSLDRGKMIAVQKSGDSDDEHPASTADLKEYATAGSTNTGSGFGGSGGSVGHQMQRRAFNTGYSGSPGKTGTRSPKQPKPKMQKPTDNALDKKGNVVT
jgi:5'(3')-deoxyribonucleotidase